jgi:hypothetical protein
MAHERQSVQLIEMTNTINMAYWPPSGRSTVLRQGTFHAIVGNCLGGMTESNSTGPPAVLSERAADSLYGEDDEDKFF